MTKLAQVGILSAVLAVHGPSQRLRSQLTDQGRRAPSYSQSRTAVRVPPTRRSSTAGTTPVWSRPRWTALTVPWQRLDARMIRQRFGRPWMQPRRRPQPQERTLTSACG